MAGESVVEEGGVSDVSPSAEEAADAVFVRLEIDVDDGVAFAKQSALEDASEEA